MDPMSNMPRLQPRPMERFTQEDQKVLDPVGHVAATARSPEEARRIVAAVNAVAGMPTDALEYWTVGVINDPVHQLAAELEALIDFGPFPNDRRKGERRQGERRRAPTEVRIEEKAPNEEGKQR